jgi:tetratricopeptide (TPR) repeat protein
MLFTAENPEALQTLASVRISQSRLDDARSALTRSLASWKDLPPADPRVPEFPMRISLSRLLIESQMHDEALEVLERLVTEDDSSVEAWYLGGWCQYLSAEAESQSAKDRTDPDDSALLLRKSSRGWLQNGLKMYQMLDYEDDRLRDHANELIHALDEVLGPATEDGDEDEEGEWEDAVSDEDGDETMEGS